jgi:predicted phage tail component-like protein
LTSFNFAGKNSYSDYGIIVEERSTIPSPKRRVTSVDVPGKNSSLHFDENTYDDITFTVACWVDETGENLNDKLDDIKGWLFGAGESELIFSYQSDKKYIAQAVNAINFSTLYKIIGKFPILFNCRPFKQAVSNLVTTLNAPGQIVNVGSIYSEPIIKVYGTGNGTLTIGSQVITLTGISSSIVIDSTIQDCYAADGSNLNNKMSGDFPTFDVGINSISFTGAITKIDITPNWRWI